MDNETPGVVCANCGHIERNPNARICPNCGAALPAPPPVMAQQQLTPPPVVAVEAGQPQQPWAMMPDYSPPQKSNSNKVAGRILIGCGIVAVLLVLGLLALCGVISI